ncbi:disease resistance protein RUN1 isoform X2 [Hevea brasiliensis]|uniref:disease resistance protein RUN1 isoform X2 n=1 Tax=Hevea brasiliensis TaxID=3981 RepID=UPI0025EA369A|nr:disease resistance protein RUN1 isoform X2 [Hevea brasiliensis]
MASCSSSSSSLKEEKYEVFLSFRGEDTCSNFASDLNAALCQKQVKTFVDDSLRRGDNEISPLISEEVIEESKLALIIFSKYFASSTWCLDVLVKILECKRRNGQIIVPVFYHVDPSDVEKQTGYFGDAFVNLEEQFKEEMDKVHRWRAALREVANLSGWVSLATRLQMHDLLQDMGWEIVLKESIKEPGKRSRLWRAEDVHHVLTKNLGTRRIEAISLNMSAVSEIQVDFKAFFAMTNLRLLEFYTPEMGNYKVHLPHGLMSLPDKLRYLRWDGYPLKSFPSNFVPQNLVELILSDGKVEQLWIGVQNLVNLKRISLRACNHLIAIPDLSRATNLEEIDLSHCISLVDVFSSIRCLNKLIHLNIISCKSLRNLPGSINMDTRGDAAEELQDDICSWKSLQYLSVHGCSRLAKFPEISGNIKQLDLSGTSIKDVPTSIGCLSGLVDLALRNCSKLESLPGSICQLKLLEILQVDGTSIKELPSQIENLQGLVELSLSNCKDLVKLPEKIGHLKSLRKLVLNGCNLLEIPDSIGCLSSLKVLDLSENNFEILPACISELSRLLYLGLKYCKRFQSLPQLPPRLILLDAHECTSLETVSGLLTRLKKYNFEFIFTNCLKLDESTQRTILLYVQMSFLRGRYPYSFHFPGRTIPKWFVNQSRGSSLTIHLPPDWFNCKFLGFTLCAVVKFQDYLADSGFQVLGSYHFKDSYSHHLHFSFCFGGWDAEQGHPRSILSDHLLLGFDPSLYAEGYEIFSQHYYNEVLIEFRFLDRFLKPVGTECKVKKCGARLAYAQDEKNASSMMRETKRCCDDNYYNEAELCGCGNDGSNKKRDCKRFKETNYIHNAWP